VAQDYTILPGNLHVWNPVSHTLGSVPAHIVAKESESYSLREHAERRGWKRVATDTIIVAGDVRDEALKTAAVTAQKLDGMLEALLGGRRRYIYTILIFQSRSAFCKYAAKCGAGNALSLYDPRTREMAVHFGDAVNPEDFLETFAHELTHAYMHIVYDVTGPAWFAEGMAEYFSKVKWSRGGFRPTGKNMDAAIHLIPENRIPLGAILSAAHDDIHASDFTSEYYANFWALVHFLINRHPEVVEMLLRKEHPDLTPLRKEYEAYVNRLMGE